MRRGSEGLEGRMLPGTTEIGPEVEANDFDLPRLEAGMQIAMECVCLRSFHLVLDRDVWPPGLHVLWAEPGYELAFQRGADAFELWVLNFIWICPVFSIRGVPPN